MAAKTIIAWTDKTFNIAWGCAKVSPGCKNCYAETLSTKYKWDVWGKDKPRRIFNEKHWQEPLRWNEWAKKEGRRHLVFSSSMCDIFEDHKTIRAELRKLWPLIKATPFLEWQLLTKRPENIAESLPRDWDCGYKSAYMQGYENVWLGVSIENNDYVWRADFLRNIPAKIHFVSYEPALGPLDQLNLNGIQWMVYGGESGRGFRAENKDWARDMLKRCRALGIPFFHKQSSGIRTEMGIELDGKIVREYPISLSIEMKKPELQLFSNVGMIL